MLSELTFSSSAQVLLSKVFTVFFLMFPQSLKDKDIYPFLKCDYVNIVHYPLYIQGEVNEILKHFSHCQI